MDNLTGNQGAGLTIVASSLALEDCDVSWVSALETWALGPSPSAGQPACLLHVVEVVAAAVVRRQQLAGLA